MIFGVIVYSAVGVLLIVLGLVTWKKQKIDLLHDYHTKNVKAQDVPAYTRAMGIGQIVIGAGLCVTGILSVFVQSPVSLLALVPGLVAGILIFHKAQMRYNGSWFS